jgi:hypothetical protein
MARVVAEMYRIENVIYIRIKAVGDLQLSSPAKLLAYRPRGRQLPVALADGHAREASDPFEPARV